MINFYKILSIYLKYFELICIVKKFMSTKFHRLFAEGILKHFDKLIFSGAMLDFCFLVANLKLAESVATVTALISCFID